MRLLSYVAAGALFAAFAAAQMPAPDQPSGRVPQAGQGVQPGADPGTAPTDIPDIPAGDDPMDRHPDPAAGTPAAKGSGEFDKGAAEPDGALDTTECRVEHAATDTGFVVVCQ